MQLSMTIAFLTTAPFLMTTLPLMTESLTDAPSSMTTFWKMTELSTSP
jgi:hypothetical protein